MSTRPAVSIDCSSNPNYPAAARWDTYHVSVAGIIGGSLGLTLTGGADNTPSAGAVALQVISLAHADLADV